MQLSLFIPSSPAELASSFWKTEFIFHLGIGKEEDDDEDNEEEAFPSFSVFPLHIHLSLPAFLLPWFLSLPSFPPLTKVEINLRIVFPPALFAYCHFL